MNRRLPRSARTYTLLPYTALFRALSWCSDVGVYVGLGLAAGMGDGALVGRADGRRVAPDGARLVVVLARLPLGLARGQLVVRQLDVQGPLDRKRTRLNSSH